MSKRDHGIGVYRKFEVRRVDGRDAPGEKHHGCRYFVLDLDHDEYSMPALRAYAEACHGDFPERACNLMSIVNQGEVSKSMAERFERERPSRKD